jgi:hypothetical protein
MKRRLSWAVRTGISSALFALVITACCETASAQTAFCWINPQTGAPYPPQNLVPLGTDILQFGMDPNHAHILSGPTVAGSDRVRVPCPPPPPQLVNSGFGFGGFGFRFGGSGFGGDDQGGQFDNGPRGRGSDRSR